MEGDSQCGRAGRGALRGGAGGVGYGRGGGGGRGRRAGGTATLPKYSQLQGGAGPCQCRAGETVGDVTDVHIVHLGRKIRNSHFFSYRTTTQNVMLCKVDAQQTGTATFTLIWGLLFPI